MIYGVCGWDRQASKATTFKVTLTGLGELLVRGGSSEVPGHSLSLAVGTVPG